MNYEEYIKAELLILIPALYIAGSFLKKAGWIKDNYIPLVIGGIGIVLSTIYVVSTEGINGLSIFTSIVQGILTSGAAVYTNQIIKQTGKESL